MKLVEFNEINQTMIYQAGYCVAIADHIAGTVDSNTGKFLKHRMSDSVVVIGGNDGIGMYKFNMGELNEITPSELEDIVSDICMDDDISYLIKICIYNSYTLLYNLINILCSVYNDKLTHENMKYIVTKFYKTIDLELLNHKLELDITDLGEFIYESTLEV